MKNPYPALLKASRLTRKGRPLSAAMAINKLIFAPAKPAARRKKAPANKRVGKPVTAARSTRPAPGTFVDASFSSAFGAISYKLYTPVGSSRRKLPLVVMLHGCTQSAADFAAGTGMNKLADEIGFLVLYPEQSRSANFGRCWNWHRSGDQERGGGEPATIAALTRHIIKSCKAHPDRVYIAGLSAGGAAAAIVAAAYPDVFVAVGVHSGVARGSINSLRGALSAMRSGVESRISDGRRRRQLPTIVFHGDRDDVVHPSNARGFVSAMAARQNRPLRVTAETGRSSGGRDFTRTTYHSGSGELLEHWSVHGSGHAWSGGSSAGSHTDPAGPAASREMLRFFLAQKRSN